MAQSTAAAASRPTGARRAAVGALALAAALATWQPTTWFMLKTM